MLLGIVAVAAHVEDEAVESRSVQVANVGEGSAAIGLPTVHDRDRRAANLAATANIVEDAVGRHEPSGQCQLPGRNGDGFECETEVGRTSLDRAAPRQADPVAVSQGEAVDGGEGEGRRPNPNE